MRIVPLEKLFRPEAFRDKVLVKVEDGIYEVNAGVSLADTARLAEAGWFTVIVHGKGISTAQLFFPSESEFGVQSFKEAKVEKIYFVRMDKYGDFVKKLAEQTGRPLLSSTKFSLGVR